MERPKSYAYALKSTCMDPSEDLLQLSQEEIAKQLEDYFSVRYARVEPSQSISQMNTTEKVGITTLQPSYAQAVCKMEKMDAMQPLSPEKVANHPDDIIQVGNGGVKLTPQTAGQMNVANIEVATKLRPVKNVEIVPSPSEKPYITESATDPPTSSIKSLQIGTSQYEDEMNAEKQGELATSESKRASVEKKQEMRKSRNRKENKKNGGGQVSSSLAARKKIEKQLEGHNGSVGNAEFASSQPVGQMNVKNLRVVTVQSEGYATEENAEISTSHLERPGIIQSEVGNSPTNSSINSLEIDVSLLSNNTYWTVANLDNEMNAENQGNETSESKDASALLEKPKRKKPKNYKKKKLKIGNGEGSSAVNVPSNRCCSRRNIALLTILLCIVWLALLWKELIWSLAVLLGKS